MELDTFYEVYEYYLAAVYQRDVLAGAIARRLAESGAGSVLDCACGTGLPALDLRAQATMIDCTDGDPLMLEQFRRNARRRGVSDSCRLYEWLELPRIGRQYDYVFCRGNSLAYGGSWLDPSRGLANTNLLEDSIRAIASILAPGGHLLVDAPLEHQLASVAYPEIMDDGHSVFVTEQVTCDGRARRWAMEIRIDGVAHSFIRHSTDLVCDDLVLMVRNVGLVEIERIDLEGERPSYGVLVARRPPV